MNATLIKKIIPSGHKFRIDFLWNFGSTVILGLCGIGVNIVIARYKGAEALGVFNQVFAFYIFASQLCTGGVQFSVLRYVSIHQADPYRCMEIVAPAIILVILLSGPVCLIAWYGKESLGSLLESEGVVAGLKMAIPGLFFFALN